MNFWITLVIVSITYIGIAIGGVPRLKMNRTTITLVGAGLLILTRQMAFDQIGKFLDLDTLILLFSMMIINANLQIAGFFRMTGNTLLKLAHTPRALLAIEIVVTGFLSAFFLNDTICLMFTLLVLDVTLAANRNPIPYLIALATSANIGSTATLTGNPQNMIIGVASRIPYVDFALALTPVALLGLGGIWFILVLFYPDEFKKEQLEIIPTLNEPNDPSLLRKCLVIVAGLLLAFFLGVPIAEASFLAACALLITRRVKPQMVFAEFDWSLLVFFSGLFVLTGALEANGVTASLFGMVNLNSQANIWSLSTVTVVLSNLVSNVPAVLLLKPVIVTLSNVQAGWLTLAAASTLAGNLTLIGSVANLIVAEIALKRQIHLEFWEYTKAGILITAISFVTGMLWIHFFVWR
jgi:Na+/H+ antiporter NhaD/arsenite permease-like protein